MPILTFTSGHPPYNAGEVAAFTDDEAAALLAAGVATAVNDNTPAEAPEDAAPAAEPPAPPAGDGGNEPPAPQTEPATPEPGAAPAEQPKDSQE